jgi:hypothetical protein
MENHMENGSNGYFLMVIYATMGRCRRFRCVYRLGGLS